MPLPAFLSVNTPYTYHHKANYLFRLHINVMFKSILFSKPMAILFVILSILIPHCLLFLFSLPVLANITYSLGSEPLPPQ